MMNDDDNVDPMTTREWFAARIVIGGGFILAIIVAAYFTWSQHMQIRAAAEAQAQAQAAAQAAQSQTQGQTAAQANARAGAMLCLRELVNAETSGIIPNYGKLTSLVPTPTQSRGRYACSAGTSVAKYTITGDLVCRDLRDATCVKLVSITRDDGTVLYQSQN